MTKKKPASLNWRRLELDYTCDICGKKRSKGHGDKCSRIRQAQRAAEG